MSQKKSNHLLFPIICVFVMTFSGCATTHDALPGKKEGPEGISKVYPVNADQAWEIGKVVFGWEGRRSIEEHRDKGYMLSGSGIGPVVWGTVMVAQFEPVGADKTRVTVITRRVTANPATPMFKEDSFHRLFTEAVEIVNKGGPLPAKAPD